MENLTHSLVGIAAAKAGLDRLSPYATPVAVLAANLPDIDTVFLFAGRYVYLEQHRGVSHSIVGTLVLATLFPIVFWSLERIYARVRKRTPRARLKGLLLCSLCAGATHPILDWTNNYGWRPLLPWDSSWIYGDLVFIVDPWLWLILGGAGFLCTANSCLRVTVWAGLALVLTFAFVFLPELRGLNVPLVSRVVWIVALISIIGVYRLDLAKRPESDYLRRSIALGALLLVVLYWTFLALLHANALEQARDIASGYGRRDNSTVLKVAAMPMFADPFSWRCAAETTSSTHRFDVSLTGPHDQPAMDERLYEKPQGTEAGLVRAASEDPRARIFLGFARFPVATVRRNPRGETVVQLVDIRFTEPGDANRGSFVVEIPIQPQTP